MMPMSQMSLFAGSGETVLVDDRRGRIGYTPDLVSAETARAWFAELPESVAWKTQRRRMYDRDVDVPRLMAHFRLAPSEDSAPDAIRAAASDHLDEIVRGFPIALLSLGATRRVTIRAKVPARRVLHVDLSAGSLLVMSYQTQVHYTHGIPKIKGAGRPPDQSGFPRESGARPRGAGAPPPLKLSDG